MDTLTVRGAMRTTAKPFSSFTMKVQSTVRSNHRSVQLCTTLTSKVVETIKGRKPLNFFQKKLKNISKRVDAGYQFPYNERIPTNIEATNYDYCKPERNHHHPDWRKRS